MISFCSYFLALCGNLLACFFSMYLFIVSACLDFSDVAFQIFVSVITFWRWLCFYYRVKLVCHLSTKVQLSIYPFFLVVVDSRI